MRTRGSIFWALTAMICLHGAVANSTTFESAPYDYVLVDGDMKSHITFDYGDATVTVEMVSDHLLVLEATVLGDWQPARLTIAVPRRVGDTGGAELSSKLGGNMTYLVDSNMELELYSSRVSDCIEIASEPAVLILASTVKMLEEQDLFDSKSYGLAIDIAKDGMARFTEDCAADLDQFDKLALCDPETLASDGVCVTANRAEEMSRAIADRMSMASEQSTASTSTFARGTNPGPCCLSCYDCCRKSCGDNVGPIGGSWECVWICW